MKKGKFKIALLVFIFIFLISSNIDISNKILTHYNNDDKDDDDYSNRIHLTQSPINSSHNWWNSLYNYRSPINITNINTKKLPKGYSVNISVNTAKFISEGKLRSDGYDLRIVWYNSSNRAWLELDRVNESNFNTIDTKIWFKTQEIIDPGTSDTNYYLYYGNPNAFNPPMNGSKVYDFYSDFTQPNGAANGWTNISGSWSVVNNEYRENSTSLDCTSLLNSYNIENFSIELRVKTNGTSFGVGVKFRYESETNFFCAGLGYWDKEISFGKHNISGWNEIEYDGINESNLISDQWYTLRIESIGNHHKIYLDDILRIDNFHNEHLTNNGTGFLTWSTNTSFYDDLKIRLLMAPEPILTLGNEEIYRHSSNEFLYYKTFTIDSAKVIGSTDLIDFPLLITIEDSDLRHHCQPDGDDIAFSNGTIWLDHEIELFNQTLNGTHAKFVTWIRIPSLSATMDTDITMYYGNSTMNSQENPKGVWNTNYKGVWHLKEDPSVFQIKDSTSNFYHGISYGSMTSNDQVEGQIGGSVKFDGLNDYINLGSDSGLRPYDAFTIEAWYNGIFNTSATENTRSPIYTNGFSYNDQIGIRVQAFHSPDSRRARVTIGDGITRDVVQSDYNISDNTWTHLVCTYNGSVLNLYINGTKQIDDILINVDYNANDAAIGANLDNAEQWYEGKVDELRVSDKSYSADWIATEYNNQYEPNSFYLVSTENLVHNYLPHENYFTYYKIITINHTQVSGDGVLLDFPLLLSIIDSDLRDKVQVDGDDIAFAKDNIWLDHEIEVFNFTYSSTESQLIAWVGIPFLSGVNDTQFRMYYGNSTMNSQENPSGIWDANTFGVWHLSEIGNGTNDEYIDSGKYSNHGQGGEGDPFFVPTQISGIIGFAQDFNNLDGKYDLIDCGNNTIFDISGNQITLQAWIKHNITPQEHFYGIMNHKGWYDGYSLWIEQNSLQLAFNLPGDTHKLLSDTDISTNTWHHIVATYDGSYMRIYIDGIQDPNNLSKVNNIEPSSSEKDFWIGHGDQPQDKLWSSEYEGQIDEVRISNIARTGEWIATEYNNQYDPNSFYSIGTEYTTFNHPPNFEYFKYYKEIIIDHTKIEGMVNLLNFTVLINILDSDLYDQNKVQVGGEDIAFALNNIWLDHEIEYFNQTYSGTQAKLVAWVRIPSLSPSTDTIIKIYYGNSTMSSRENPTGTWDNNYVGVWHLSEDPSGVIYDSTSNNNDGTSIGNIDQMDGIIDGSLNFYGANDYINCGNDSSLDISENITIEHWIKGNDFSNDPDTLTKGTYQESYSVWIWADGTVTFELNNQIFNSTNAISTGVWNFITCTYDGNTRRIFINGTEDNSGSYSTPIEIVTSDLTISSDSWSFDGSMDEIRISNIIRSPYWLKTQYNNHYNPNSFYSIGIENQIETDTSAPDITINSPNPDDLFGWSAPDYDLTIIDANLDSIWYTLNDGFTNSTPSTAESGTIDQTLWGAQGNGTVTIRFYANDTLGNINYEEVIVRKDIVNPSISIDLPLSGSNHSSPPSYSLSIIEANLDKIWYSLDGGSNNYTGAESGTIDSTAWSNAGQGAITIIFYVNDSAGNWNSTNIQINRDTIVPSIDSIDSPLPGEWFNSSPPDYSLSITEVNLDKIWYSLDGGSNNYTGAESGTIDSTAWSNAGQGAITIIFYVNDSAGNWNSASVQINRDTIAPTIIITEPNNYDLFGITPPDITIDINDPNLDERWYQLDNGTVITGNYTWTGLIAQSVWDQVGNGTVIIRFYANDTVGNLGTEEVIVYKDIKVPIITINSPNYNDVFNSTAPSFIVGVSGNNLDTRWYTLDGGLVNYTFTGLSGIINPSAWSIKEDGPITIIFYINNTLGIIGFDEITIIKDTLAPQITINLPSNSTYCGTAPIINILAIDPNLDAIWYRVNTIDILLGNNINQQLDTSIWSSLIEGEFYIYIYANDTLGNLNNSFILTLYKDTISPSAPILTNSPSGESSLPLIFDWLDGSDPSGIAKYRLIIDTEADPFATPGFVFEVNITNIGPSSSYYEYTESLQPGTYYYFLYQIDGAGNQSPASTGSFLINLPIITINSPNFNDVFNSTAPSFIVAVSGSNLDARWYTLDGGLVNYTFTGLSGIINPSAWSVQEDGPITIIFYINNTLGIIGFDEITIIKDTLAPQITINLPLNNTYCRIAPVINISATDPNLDAIWYRVNTTDILLGNHISQQLDASIWSNLPQGEFYIYIYANDSVSHLNIPIILILYKDTILPPAPELLDPPQGEVNLPIIFNWTEGNDPSGIVKYRLIIDTEPNNPFATPGFVFEINITGNYYEYSGTLQPGTYYFFLYQIDGAGNQSPASGGSFSIGSSSQPSEPSEFPIWIIIVIIGAAIGGVVGFVVLKKAKSKEVKSVQISQKKPVPKPKLEFREELKLMDYETLKNKAHRELNDRERKLLDYIKYLEENKDYTKAAEFAGELIIIEEILANPNKVELYRQKQIDIAIKGLDYLKDQYEIESKKAAISGDYSKSLELYKESKLISENLKIYVEGQKSSHPEESTILETKEPQMLMGEVEIVYSCINDLLTKYFDEIGIKYYSNPQIYDDIQSQIHGLILTDNELLIADIDPSIRDKIKSIQIIYTEDISNENVLKLCKNFQNPNVVLTVVGIKWPRNIETQTIEIPSDKEIKYQENIRIIHYELFSTLIGLKGDYEIAFKEIIQLYYNSEFNILRETLESSEIIIHSTDELFYDLKEKGLIEHKLQEYFHR